MAAFLKEYFCGVPVLAGWVYAFCGSMSRWVYAFCGSMSRNSGRLVSENAQFRNHLLDLSYLYIFFIIL